MNISDDSVLQNLQNQFKTVDYTLIKNIWEETQGDLNTTLDILRVIYGPPQVSNGDSSHHSFSLTQNPHSQHDYSQHSQHGDDSVSIGGFSNIDEIQDPDLRFAMQLQREELEREEKLRKQQQEDESLAQRLHEGEHPGSQVQPQQYNNAGFNSNPVQMNINKMNQEENPFKILGDMLERRHMKGKAMEEEAKAKIPIEEDDGTCVVCLNADRNAIFAPCAHKCCCIKCASEIAEKKKFCPLCWTELEGVIETRNG